ENVTIDDADARAEYFAVRVDHMAPCVGRGKRQGVSAQVKSARIQRYLQSIIGRVAGVGDLRDVAAVRISFIDVAKARFQTSVTESGRQAARVPPGIRVQIKAL